MSSTATDVPSSPTTTTAVLSSRSRSSSIPNSTACKTDAHNRDSTVSDGKSRTDTQAALSGETADLLYHALVLLAERGLPPATVIETLRERHRP